MEINISASKKVRKLYLYEEQKKKKKLVTFHLELVERLCVWVVEPGAQNVITSFHILID